MGKRYKCPYCNERHERYDLITHVEDEHEDLIPEGQTPTQVVFNSINKKTHGICIVCKKDTEWNEKTGKYNRLCNDPKCRQKLREEFKKNATAKDGTYNYTANPKFQEKMLKGRKISSTYKFTDGGVVDYVGSYEKKFLEFVDKVMNIESKDIIGPGPTIEYEFNGEIHHWITDFYYVPGNLVLDIKDGGKNPNTRPMEEYREKQIAKEKAIRELKKYNYLRLTDNNFSQFMEVLADLKAMALDITQTKLVTKINEAAIEELSAGMSTVPPQWANDANVMITNNLAGETKVALSSLDFNDSILVDNDEEGIKKVSKKEFKENYTIKEQFLVNKNEKYYNLLEAFKNHSDDIYKGIYCNLSSFDNIITENQIYFDKEFKKLANKGIDQNVLDLSKRVEKVNNALELGLSDNDMEITLPKMDLDQRYEVKSMLHDGKPTTKITLNNSVIATFDKSTQSLGIKEYDQIEEAVSIFNEYKEFPIQVNDGDLYIKNIKRINFYNEYNASHKILKMYYDAGNLEGVKYELAKMCTLNKMLEYRIYNSKFHKKDKEAFENIRKKLLIDYNKYMKLVISKDDTFIFGQYYDQSEFSNTVIKVGNETILTMKNLFKHLNK